MKVFLTGGNGMLGKAIRRMAALHAPAWEIHAPSSKDLDLSDRARVRDYLRENKFDYVIHAAAKVGGIKANMADPVGFLAENMQINTNVIEESRLSGVRSFLFLGSSCMYPRNYRNPLLESDILAAPLEPTNEGYALSKIAGSRHCAYISNQYGLTYRTFIPCNLYGPGDHFDPERGHLIAAAMLKVHMAKFNHSDDVEIWGDGTARREFMYVDDLAHFIVTSHDRLADMPDCLNTGLGRDYTVTEYYQALADVVGYSGSFRYKLDAPTGMQQKLMDSSLAKPFGWNPETQLRQGLEATYRYFLETQNRQG